jgi:hypothetical protein
VPPHCQHTGRLFLWLSIGLDHVNTDAVDASLTGTSSWPSRSTWRPTSTAAWYACRISSPRMNSSVISVTNTQIFRPAAPESAVPAPLSRRGSSVWNQLAGLTVGQASSMAVPLRCLALQQSQMPQRRWSHDTTSPASSRQRPVCPWAWFRNLFSSSSCLTLTALILLLSLSSTSFLTALLSVFTSIHMLPMCFLSSFWLACHFKVR